MRKIFDLTLALTLTLFITGCSAAPKFQSQACPKAVASTPIITNKILIQFTRLHINLIPDGNSLTVVMPTDYFFRLGSPRLKPSTYPNLDQLVLLLKKYGPAKMKIMGFTDNVADPQQNLLTSEQQARALLTYLWVKSIPAEQLYAVGYGDRVPVADNATVTGSAANRRIEITVKASCV